MIIQIKLTVTLRLEPLGLNTNVEVNPIELHVQDEKNKTILSIIFN